MPPTLHELYTQLHIADNELEQLLEKRNEIQHQIELARARRTMHARGDMLGAMVVNISKIVKDDHVKALFMANTVCIPFREDLPARYFKHTLDAIPEEALPSGWTQAQTEAFFEAVLCALERDMTAMVALGVD
jgi:hypothetical protein